MSYIGLLILGVILAIIGYVLERKGPGPFSTVGTILFWIGVILAIVGAILLGLALAGVSLLVLPFP